MKKGCFQIGLILDASSSMESIEDEIKDTLREFARSQQAEKDADETIVLDVWQFDDEVKHIISKASLETYDPDRYSCGGCTALYDAICKGVDSLKRRFARLPEEERPEDVLIAIVTDGMENSSSHSLADVQKRIKGQTEAGWKFMFLASNIDVDQTGEDLGVEDAEDRVELNNDRFAEEVRDRMVCRAREIRLERAERRRRERE